RSLCFFFFQAEDGIRDLYVTGVQTCALPIWLRLQEREKLLDAAGANAGVHHHDIGHDHHQADRLDVLLRIEAELDEVRRDGLPRSEERRVGKECRARWASEQ